MEKPVLKKHIIQSYAKLLDLGYRTINEVEEDYVVDVYLYLMQEYNWSLNHVNEKYIDRVKERLEM